MIEGIQMDFKSSELKKHLVERSQHHKRREAFYLSQVRRVRQAGTKRASYGTDPVTALENKAKSHRVRRELYALMSRHIVPDEIYRLKEEDLNRIELLSDRPGRFE